MLPNNPNQAPWLEEPLTFHDHSHAVSAVLTNFSNRRGKNQYPRKMNYKLFNYVVTALKNKDAKWNIIHQPLAQHQEPKVVAELWDMLDEYIKSSNRTKGVIKMLRREEHSD